MLLQPVFGALSDRIGRRNNMILFSGCATLAAVPLLMTLSSTTNVYAVFGLIMTGLVIACFYTSISGVVKAELFPPEVRALGVGLPYAIANAMFGGTAEYVALSLKSVRATKLYSSGTSRRWRLSPSSRRSGCRIRGREAISRAMAGSELNTTGAVHA